VTTIFISMPPFNLPPWAIFIGWAGTFAAGGLKPRPPPQSKTAMMRLTSMPSLATRRSW
jgi:hypothetical protein